MQTNNITRQENLNVSNFSSCRICGCSIEEGVICIKCDIALQKLILLKKLNSSGGICNRHL